MVMPKLDFRVVRDWLKEADRVCNLEQLLALQMVLEEAIARFDKREKAQAEMREKMDALAREAGFKDATDLLGFQVSVVASAGAKAKWPRKPHMDPFNPQSDAYALTKFKVLPGWAAALIAQGWTLDELHYKNHARALKDRGLPPVYDAVARHKELMSRYD